MQGSGSGLCLPFKLKTYSSLGKELKVNLHGPAKSAKKNLIYLNVSQSIKLKRIGTRDQTILSYFMSRRPTVHTTLTRIMQIF